jgi:hypothetical protein
MWIFSQAVARTYYFIIKTSLNQCISNQIILGLLFASCLLCVTHSGGKMQTGKIRSFLIGLGAAGLGLSAYALWIRPWHLRWGANDDEVAMSLPGDEFVPEPQLNATHAITINTPASYVWPWLAQMGQNRGGFYSYDWLENLCGCQLRNADSIHPEWQDLKVGDSVWLHPKAPPLKVLAIEPGQAIVLEKCWTFCLIPIDEKATRLIIRGRGEFNPNFKNGLLNLAVWRGVFEPAHFIMERKMMLAIKELAEKEFKGQRLLEHQEESRQLNGCEAKA